ncbi:MAG TPA: glycerol-3-phosphate dehydrogenase/oxidase [Acidimicrobiales bacterium]|nr:glycerol-3-phosphate dehydrogenase/oxidase [Acidimicrobiales bacterium]
MDRAELRRRLVAETWDVLVIGGGITGAGVALDAASRGLRTALVEACDFASGTSSRSSKFVHGGLRYLRSHDFGLVAQSVAEQRRLLRNAPHLVHPVPLLLPVAGVARRLAAGAVLALHDLAAGTGVSRPVRGGLVFHEAQVDDARLTLAVVRTAVLGHGAVAVNACPVAAVDGQGVTLAGGERVRARVVVNAAGPDADRVRALAGPAAAVLRPTKGVHVVVARDRLPLTTGLVLPDGAGGFAFAVPWEDRVVVGTTDTPHRGGPVECTADDVALLLARVNPALAHPLGPGDVLGRWAGLRPLVEGGRSARAELARRHLVATGPGGMVTVVGGKLTTYRRMASDAVDVACARLGVRAASRTTRLPLRGAGLRRPDGVDERLWRRYGTEAAAVQALARAEPGLAAPLVPGLAYLRAEAVWAVREEMALTLDDVLSRRTRATILDAGAAAAAGPAVAALLAPELGWSEQESRRQVAAYLAAAAVQPAR